MHHQLVGRQVLPHPAPAHRGGLDRGTQLHEDGSIRCKRGLRKSRGRTWRTPEVQRGWHARQRCVRERSKRPSSDEADRPTVVHTGLARIVECGSVSPAHAGSDCFSHSQCTGSLGYVFSVKAQVRKPSRLCGAWRCGARLCGAWVLRYLALRGLGAAAPGPMGPSPLGVHGSAGLWRPGGSPLLRVKRANGCDGDPAGVLVEPSSTKILAGVQALNWPNGQPPAPTDPHACVARFAKE